MSAIETALCGGLYTLLINFVAGMKGDNVAYGKVR